MSGYQPSDYERRREALELAFREQHDKGPSAPLDVIGRAAEFEDYLRNGSAVRPVDGPAPFVD